MTFIFSLKHYTIWKWKTKRIYYSYIHKCINIILMLCVTPFIELLTCYVLCKVHYIHDLFIYLIFYFTKHTIINRSYAGYTRSHVNQSTHQTPKKSVLPKLVWLKKTKINKFKHFSYTDIGRTRENHWSCHY